MTAEDRLHALLATVPADVDEALQAVSAAVEELAGRPVSTLVRDPEGWRARVGPDCPPERVTEGPPAVVRRGGVAVVDPAGALPEEMHPLLERACTWLTLALERDRAEGRSRDSAVETVTVTEVVETLLAVHDVDQLLLSIADRTLRLLDADICGVLLREGDEVCMRSCVGHRVIDTARLRMTRGQGVAGLVFRTGRPARVDRYVDDETISRDFVDLAEREQTESALAVPMAIPGEFLGVLEVWRRRPSVFTDRDVRRMVTLADFATIALRGAREHDAAQRALTDLAAAHETLQRQAGILGRSAELQQRLMTTVLDGGGLPALARTVARHLEVGVGVYDTDGEALAVHGEPPVPDRLPRRAVAEHPGRAQTIHAEGAPAGRVYLRGADPAGAELVDATVGQVAMACSLAVTRERAAHRERAEALDETLWDLLAGSTEHRIAARGRAAALGVVLGTTLRVLVGRLENLEEIVETQGGEVSRADRIRREVLAAVRDPGGAGPALCGRQGDTVVAVVADLSAAEAKARVDELIAALRERHPGLRTAWGVSRGHDDPLELPHADAEARTALSASRRLGGQSVFLYEELGVVRLLLGSGEDPDLRTFIADVTGPLVAYDRDNDGALIRTLRAYFDADCSQRVAAERLFVHHKTMRYRLELIHQLTGLDLRRHDDRVRADVALRLLQFDDGG